jgi:hypothetical protein
MGIGISAMHYIGMEAMRLQAMGHYSPGIVALSVVLAIAISLVALWLKFSLCDDTGKHGWRKPASAVLMGAAIPVMHYTGVAAVSYLPMAMQGNLDHALEISGGGAGRDRHGDAHGTKPDHSDIVYGQEIHGAIARTESERTSVQATGGIGSGDYLAAECGVFGVQFHPPRGGRTAWLQSGRISGR